MQKISQYYGAWTSGALVFINPCSFEPNFLMFPSSSPNFHQYSSANFVQPPSMQTQQHRVYPRQFSFGSPLPLNSSTTTPSPPLNIGLMPTTPVLIQNPSCGMKCGVGILIWLSPHAGLLSFGDENDFKTSENNNNNLVSFEIKDFGDQAVSDLTHVLRVGFVLKFQAVSSLTTEINKPRYIATFVAPASSEDLKTAATRCNSIAIDLQRLLTELDTHSMEILPCPDQNRRQNPYDVVREMKVVKFMMNLFRDINTPHCPLHTIHCIVSNCGDEQLYNYIGTSSMKRRQFIERHGHLFSITSEDLVCLVPGSLYVAINTLIREILKRGGATLLQELFDGYLTWPDVPLESRELVGETKQQFLKFLESYPWIFSVFPSRVFVAVRRRLPDFDYCSFLVDCFGDGEGSPFWNCRRPSPPPAILTPQTPKLLTPSTFSACNEEISSNLTKFPFVHNEIWPNFGSDPPPPPVPNAPRVKTSTTDSSVGSSSLSLASYGSEPVPPTPPSYGFINDVHPAQPPAGSDFAPTTPGFWKSYDLGTEEFVKNLTNFDFRTTSQPISASISKNFVNFSCQTDNFQCFCPNCGVCWRFGEEKLFKKAEKCEIACQTDDKKEEDEFSDDILNSVAKLAVDDD